MSNKTEIRALTPDDLAAVSALHSAVFGPGRYARTAYRVREARDGRGLISPFCRGAWAGSRLVGSVSMTPIAIGETGNILLLGPLAVDPGFAGQGIGRGLITAAIEAARSAGTRAIVLVGDAPFYGKFGFDRVKPGRIQFPGPVDQARILALDLKPGDGRSVSDISGILRTA